jgi:tetratricopeptide (TPR) repeat protein
VLVVAGLLLLAIAAVFAQTLRHDFVEYDDQTYVYENPLIRAGITARGLQAAFTKSHALNWHPLTTLSHMLDCQLYGLDPRWQHLTNVALHAATALVLLLVLSRMTGRFWPSAFVAAVFAIHPLRVESVAWVAERKDVLSGLFFTLTLAAYVGYCRRPFSLGRYLTVVACFALGLMSKPMLVTLPFVLLLLDYWPLQRFPVAAGETVCGADETRSRSRASAARLWMEKAPLFVLSAGSCVATLLAQGGELESVERFSWYVRVANAATSYVAYIGQTFWPAGLAVLYPHHTVTTFTGPHAGDAFWIWKALGASALLVSVTAGVMIARRRHPWLVVGWLWYLGMLFPVIGFVQVGWQSMADRYTYLAHIGLCLGITWMVVGLCSAWRFRRLACSLAAFLVIAGLMACAWRQTSFWRNSETLWSRALACTSRNVVAHSGLGAVLHKQGRLEEAVRQYQLALKINPAHLMAHNNLAAVFFQQGRLEEAIAHYQVALRARPDYAKAHGNLGACFFNQGKVDEAIAEYRRALKLDPDYADAHANLAVALQQQGKAEEAAAERRKARELRGGK